MVDGPDVTLITPTASMSVDRHGGRAKCLQRLVRLDMPVPPTVALSFAAVRGIAEGRMPDMTAILAAFAADDLLSVRPSSQDPDWGGPGAVLNIGMCDAALERLIPRLGEEAACSLYLRFIQSYAVEVARLDPEEFHLPERPDRAALAQALAAYEAEMDAPFPQDPGQQLAEVLRSMARAWDGTSARLLRQARGAPAEAGLGLVVQRMALGVGQGSCGSGVIQRVSSESGEPQIIGRYLSQSQGRDALRNGARALYLTRDPRGPSLEETEPEIFAALLDFGDLGRVRLREEMEISFTIEEGRLAILDAIRVQRSARAAVRIAVALAEDGVIPRDEALMRVQPQALAELLHSQVDPNAPREVLGEGMGASPGAAAGRIVLSAAEAQAAAARGEDCVLIRRETSPEDIRGMHVARAVVTLRGGLTSHAAVIGRGIGLPCVVGASDLVIDKRKGKVTGPGGTMRAGDIVTVDGAAGQILMGAPPLRAAELGEAYKTLLKWADARRDIGVRANADTPQDAQTARLFHAEGIGLCRTEHMFFEGERLGVMREMIFAGTEAARRAGLERLLPMQKADFIELFRIMAGMPVCIRLFDPPLHEFLPRDKAGLRDLAEGLGLPLAEVEAQVEAISEYNPMLGLRGVRLGLTYPEVIDMQARAIFEAVAELGREGAEVTPEIMLPLVSAMREVELVKARIEAIAAAVRAETGNALTYRLGVMVETPRAALRAGDIACHAQFLSFGTNDLTQMTYGLSRDDAGRFMSAYVRQGIYEEDPFHTLDQEGVGELISIGAARSRERDARVTLSICGEHGGSREAIRFCRQQGFDYVSCSPFRVPLARLSAAQLAIEATGAPA